jgi:hypothetical protein
MTMRSNTTPVSKRFRQSREVATAVRTSVVFKDADDRIPFVEGANVKINLDARA